MTKIVSGGCVVWSLYLALASCFLPLLAELFSTIPLTALPTALFTALSTSLPTVLPSRYVLLTALPTHRPTQGPTVVASVLLNVLLTSANNPPQPSYPTRQGVASFTT
jgi:hypothetical protein